MAKQEEGFGLLHCDDAKILGHMTSEFANEARIATLVAAKAPLTALENALRDYHRLRGFRSGGGLRVLNLTKEGKSVAYGEHWSVDHALYHVEEDLLAGGRKYKDVYGKLFPHYMTGANENSSPLDAWLNRGNSFDAYGITTRRENFIVVDLQGYVRFELPDAIEANVLKTGKKRTFLDRGFTYEASRGRMANGEPCVSTRVVRGPKDKDPFIYHIVKTAKGSNLREAIDNALAAQAYEWKD